jgi:hypothetical protein
VVFEGGFVIFSLDLVLLCSVRDRVVVEKGGVLRWGWEKVAIGRN